MKNLHKMSVKPIKNVIFKEIGGVWQDVAGDSGTLADFLQSLELNIDDRCEFARFKDYQCDIEIWYRASTGKVQITIWAIS